MLSVKGLVLQVDKRNVGRIVSKIQMTVNTNVDEVDLKATCRVCLLKKEPGNLFCLFKSNEMFEDLCAASAILDCFGIELKQAEDVPDQICITCVTSTLQAYTFKKCLKRSQEYLLKQRESITLSKTEKLVIKNEKNDVLGSPELLSNHLSQELQYCSDSDSKDNIPTARSIGHSHKSKISCEHNENIDSFLHVTADHNYSKQAIGNKNHGDDSLQNSFVNEGEEEIGNYSNKKKYEPHETNNSSELEKMGNDADLKKSAIVKSTKNSKKLQESSKTSETERWWLKEAGPPYTCQICGRAYGVRFRAFYLHARMHRVEKLPCTQCGKRFSRLKMIIHMRTHTKEKPYICDQCPARFSIEGNLKRHLRCHTGEKLYVCDLCGKAFTQSTSLQNHKETHVRKTLFVCEYCGKTLSSYNSRKFHMYTHQNETKSVHLNEENSLEVHEDIKEEHKCIICSKVFSKAVALRRHARTHTENIKYRCCLCLKIFYSELNYQIHTTWHELLLENTPTTGTKNWSCEYCSEVFIEKNDLVSHILTHMERPFVCSTCCESFITKKGLLHHLRLHNDDKPFSCTLCDKTFRYAATLKQHFRIHTGEKPYKCDICSRVFAQQQQLMSHSLTHTGEKKYICPYCGKAFALNGNLTVHKRRHTGETPYVCDECGRGFYDSSSLKKHRQGQHKVIHRNK